MKELGTNRFTFSLPRSRSTSTSDGIGFMVPGAGGGVFLSGLPSLRLSREACSFLCSPGWESSLKLYGQ